MALHVTHNRQYALLQHLEGVEGGCGEVMELGEGVVVGAGEGREQNELARSSTLGLMVRAFHDTWSVRGRKRRTTQHSLPSLMLRLRPSLILRSAQQLQDPLISKLLPVVGDLSSACNELRWLREDCQKRASESEQQSLLEQHVSRRSRGEPLQYVLGSAYFGDLEIKCRPGVFIPRFVAPDTSLPHH